MRCISSIAEIVTAEFLISYVMTIAGPEPLETLRSAIDYEHYLTRQLQPVADAILPLLRWDFENTSASGPLRTSM
ncbi:hypothetical protein LMG28727_06604 [Paraburkholderia kirstenboschensis]|nr:hypothetical protein LMG28727_06604 [Paraburkholderia kirstenboschensis]